MTLHFELTKRDGNKETGQLGPEVLAQHVEPDDNLAYGMEYVQEVVGLENVTEARIWVTEE